MEEKLTEEEVLKKWQKALIEEFHKNKEDRRQMQIFWGFVFVIIYILGWFAGVSFSTPKMWRMNAMRIEEIHQEYSARINNLFGRIMSLEKRMELHSDIEELRMIAKVRPML